MDLRGFLIKTKNCRTTEDFLKVIGDEPYYILKPDSNEFPGCYLITEDYCKEVLKYEGYLSAFSGVLGSIISPYLNAYLEPEIDSENKTVSYFENYRKRNIGARTTSKIGKFIKKYCSFYDDVQVESIVNALVIAYSKVDYEFESGFEREDFRKVYGELSISGGLDIGMYRCLNSSCMNGVRVNGLHPSEAYASGDFEINYLLDKDDKLYARTIVHLDSNTYSPIYAVSSIAGDYLVKCLKEKYPNIYEACGGEWEGAKLLKIYTGEVNEVLAPYVDLCEYAEDDGDNLVINRRGDIDISSTSGTAVIPTKCDECGDKTFYTQEVNGETLCEDCFHLCHFTDEYFKGEPVSVLSKSWLTEMFFTYKCNPDEVEEYAVLINGEWVNKDDVESYKKVNKIEEED